MEPVKLKRELSVFHLPWHLWTQESFQSFQKYHGDWGGAGPENSKCLSTSIPIHFHELFTTFQGRFPALAIFHSCSGSLGPRAEGGTEVCVGGWGGGGYECTQPFPQRVPGRSPC